MEAHIVEWLSLLGRWLHFIVGIAWIGSSLYFIWLDNHLETPSSTDDSSKGVSGELWSVHGGGFYHAQKYAVAPPALPTRLHWFKWEAYSTWLSGVFLLGIIYWYGAEIYLIDPAVATLSAWQAIGLSVMTLVAGWIVYDGLCRSPLAKSEALLTAVLAVGLGVAAWGLCQLFSGRGAYIHFGALIGTIMVGNVFFVIIPGQRRLVDAIAADRAPAAADGQKAKQRSVHNTYLTLPVLFVMISNHYAMTYGHRWNWAILIGMTVAGALIRVWFVARHKGQASPLPLIVASTVLGGIIWVTRPTPLTSTDIASAGDATFSDVFAIVQSRCTSCHARAPSYPGFVAPPAGIVLESAQDVMTLAAQIHEQSVVTRAMPVGNLTGMLDSERALIDAWYRGGARSD
ncbi:MAG: urate hydroxylase PuuD [Pseudomonadota bacterium]